LNYIKTMLLENFYRQYYCQQTVNFKYDKVRSAGFEPAYCFVKFKSLFLLENPRSLSFYRLPFWSHLDLDKEDTDRILIFKK